VPVSTDQFLTVEVPAEGYFMDKGSKFHAYLAPVNNETEFQRLLQSLRSQHPKARHFCTAYRLGVGVQLERANDDGEPSGSAGKPILGQLIKHDLTNVAIVVVRYFGGTKLGIPGLIEAYKTSTANAIANAVSVQKTVFSVFLVRMNYALLPSFKNRVIQSGIPLFEEKFEDQGTILIGFPKGKAIPHFLDFLRGYSSRDFNTLEEYARDLEIELINLNEDRVA
jgi:uncharacterized YigZ family protein